MIISAFCDFSLKVTHFYPIYMLTYVRVCVRNCDDGMHIKGWLPNGWGGVDEPRCAANHARTQPVRQTSQRLQEQAGAASDV